MWSLIINHIDCNFGILLDRNVSDLWFPTTWKMQNVLLLYSMSPMELLSTVLNHGSICTMKTRPVKDSPFWLAIKLILSIETLLKRTERKKLRNWDFLISRSQPKLARTSSNYSQSSLKWLSQNLFPGSVLIWQKNRLMSSSRNKMQKRMIPRSNNKTLQLQKKLRKQMPLKLLKLLRFKRIRE